MTLRLRPAITKLTLLALVSACKGTQLPAAPRTAAPTPATTSATPAAPATVATEIPGALYYFSGPNSVKKVFQRLRAGVAPSTLADVSTWAGSGFAISPDGARIAWNNGPNDEIYVSNVDGSGRKTIDTVAVDSMRWSPDSAWLVAQRRLSPHTTAVRLIKADGSVKRDLAPAGRSPAWSADGAWIVYVSKVRNEIYGTELTRVRLDGTGRQSVAVNSGIARVYTLASVSPGAEQVLFQATCEGCDTGDPPWYAGGGTIINFSSGGQQALTSSQGEATFALWTPDGKLLIRSMTRRGSASSSAAYALELRAKDGAVVARQAEPFERIAWLTTYAGT